MMGQGIGYEGPGTGGGAPGSGYVTPNDFGAHPAPPPPSGPGTGMGAGQEMGMGMGMGMGTEMGMRSRRPNGGGSRTSAGAGPSYDVVHMTARNARLEEKLSKALAKNRSMAKYYDQLLAKTRDAAERELEEVKREAQRMSVELGAAGSVHDQLSREREERTVVQR